MSCLKYVPISSHTMLTSMSNGSSANTSVETTRIQIEEAPFGLLIMLLSTSFWTVIINALVFACLVTNRSTLKSYVNLQLLSLSFTDMLVGIFSIPVTLSFKLVGSFPKYDICAGIFYFYVVSQGATLNHAMVICAHRLATVKRKTTKTSLIVQPHYKSIVIQILSVWAGCLTVISIPFLAFGRYGEKLQSCSLNVLFQDNYTAAIGIFTIAYLPPYICLNIVYLYMFIYLKKQWKKIGAPSTSSSGDQTVSGGLRVRQDVKTATQSIKYNAKPNLGLPKLILVSLNESTETSKISTNNQSKITRQIPNAPNQAKANVQNFTSPKRSEMRKRLVDRRPPVDVGRISGVEGQKRVLVTIGILLVALNVFMTPIVCLVLLEVLNQGYLSRKVKFIFVAIAMFNSALNPVINVLRIKAFQDILKHKALTLYRRIVPRLFRREWLQDAQR